MLLYIGSGCRAALASVGAEHEIVYCTHVQVFNVDRSNKTVVVEEGMTTSMVCHLLVVKNHFDESPNWVLVEQLGDVCLGEWLYSRHWEYVM